MRLVEHYKVLLIHRIKINVKKESFLNEKLMHSKKINKINKTAAIFAIDRQGNIN